VPYTPLPLVFLLFFLFQFHYTSIPLPFNYLFFGLLGWVVLGIILIFILRRTPGALEKIGSAITAPSETVTINYDDNDDSSLNSIQK